MKDQLTMKEASDLIGLVYDSALEKSQWRSLTARLRALCVGHVVAVTTFDDAEWTSSHAATLPEGSHGAEISEVVDAAETRSIDQPKDLHDTMFSRQPLALGTLYSTRRLFEENEFRNFAAYKSTMEPIGAGHYAGVHFSIVGNRRAALMIVENDRDETPKDHAAVCTLLELISPHMIRANGLARALSMAREASATYAGFIDAIALPLVVVSEDLKLQFANRLAQNILENGEILARTSNEDLFLPSGEEPNALRKAITACLASGAPVPLLLNADHGSIPLCVCPFRPALSEASGVDQHLLANQPLFALFLGAPTEGVVSPQLLGSAFQFTDREAEVCARLLSGNSPSKIAEETGRAEKTVRNQIQAVYDKVGVGSSRELSEALSVFRAVGSMHLGS